MSLATDVDQNLLLSISVPSMLSRAELIFFSANMISFFKSCFDVFGFSSIIEFSSKPPSINVAPSRTFTVETVCVSFLSDFISETVPDVISRTFDGLNVTDESELSFIIPVVVSIKAIPC